MTETLHLPPSVKAYLTDPAVSTGVDALLLIDSKALPPDLQWDEYGDYLAARAAAELTKLEWAPLLYQIWQRVWLPKIAPYWTLCSIEEVKSENLDVTPQACWDEKSISIMHSNDELWLYTSIQADRRSTSIAFSLETAGSDILIHDDFGQFRWREDDEWTNWLVATIPHNIAAPQFEFAVLERLAEEAMRRVHDAVADR